MYCPVNCGVPPLTASNHSEPKVLLRKRLIPFQLILLMLVLVPISGCSAEPADDIQRTLQEKARTGEVISFDSGQRVTVKNGITIPAGVTLDLNGGELIAILSNADAAGVRLLSGSAVQNGRISVVSRGTPGTQAGAHSAILVGGLIGENDAGPSRYADPSNWRISNVMVQSDKDISDSNGQGVGAAAIQVNGGAADGLIEGVTVPDSSVMLGGIMLDWGIVGQLRSDDIAGSRRQFDAQAAYSTHPHNITIRDIRIGRLTRPRIAGMGTFGIRLSGVHDIAVENVRIAEVTGAALEHTGGDLGYEFARQNDKRKAHTGIRISDVDVTSVSSGFLVRSDSFADNIARAQTMGYKPLIAPIARTDIEFSRIRGRGQNEATGLRLDHQIGGVFNDLILTDFVYGAVIDEQADKILLEDAVLTDSRSAAVIVGHPLRPPSNITILNPRVTGPGRATLIRIDRSTSVVVSGANAPVIVDHTARRARVIP